MKIIILSLVSLVIILSLVFYNCLFNFMMARGDGSRAYIIPDESTCCNFKAVRMNDGSGDWWIYGEDRVNYYHFTGIGAPPYKYISKTDALKCEGFVADDVNTWCNLK